MFRVTAQSMRESWLQAANRVQSNLARTQLQVASGQKFTRPSEDPVAATRALQLEGSVELNKQFARNSDLAKNRLSLEESALDKVGDVMQRVREIAVQANNATQTNETRAALANEAREQLQALVELANSQDGGGEYLFAGFRSRSQPFVSQAGGVAYNGDEGVRQLQIAPGRQLADGDDGAAVFMQIRNGNGTFVTTADANNTGTGMLGATGVTNPALYDGGVYTVTFTSATAYEVYDDATPTPNLVASGAFADGQTIAFAGVQFELDGAPAAGDEFIVAPSQDQSVFTTVQNFITALSTPASTPESSAQLHTSVGRSLTEFDQAIGHLLEVRSSVGGRLSAIDTQEEINADVQLNLDSLLSDIRDLDYAEALTRLQQQLTSLQAAQQSYAMTQGLSLFNYL